MIWTVIMFRIVFNFLVLPDRAVNSHASRMKHHAKNIAGIIEKNEIKMYFPFAKSDTLAGNHSSIVKRLKTETKRAQKQYSFPMCSRTTVFYIEYLTNQVVQLENSEELDKYYIANVNDVDSSQVEIYYTFDDGPDEEYYLLKFKP